MSIINNGFWLKLRVATEGLFSKNVGNLSYLSETYFLLVDNDENYLIDNDDDYLTETFPGLIITPPGFDYMIDNDDNYLIDNDDNYITEDY